MSLVNDENQNLFPAGKCMSEAENNAAMWRFIFFAAKNKKAREEAKNKPEVKRKKIRRKRISYTDRKAREEAQKLLKEHFAESFPDLKKTYRYNELIEPETVMMFESSLNRQK